MNRDERSYWVAGNAVLTYLKGGKRFNGSVDSADNPLGFDYPSFGCPREFPITDVGSATLVMKFKPDIFASLELDEESEEMCRLLKEHWSAVEYISGVIFWRTRISWDESRELLKEAFQLDDDFDQDYLLQEEVVIRLF